MHLAVVVGGSRTRIDELVVALSRPVVPLEVVVLEVLAEHASKASPGRARGWSADNWPWNASSDDTAAPLLLPWSGRARVYRFTGGQLR